MQAGTKTQGFGKPTTQRSASPGQRLAGSPSPPAVLQCPLLSQRHLLLPGLHAALFCKISSLLLLALIWQNYKVQFTPLVPVGSAQEQPSTIPYDVLPFAAPQFLGTMFSSPVFPSTQGLIKQKKPIGKVQPFALEKPHHRDLPTQLKTQAWQAQPPLPVSGRMNLSTECCFLCTCEQLSKPFCQRSAGGWSAAAAGLSSDPRWLWPHRCTAPARDRE